MDLELDDMNSSGLGSAVSSVADTGEQTDTCENEDDSDWNSDSCAAFLDGPVDAVGISTSSIQRFTGNDFEVEFQAHDDALVVREDADNRFIWEQYQAGLWAPYPEFYLLKDIPEDDNSTVFEQLMDTMVLMTDVDAEDRYIYKRIIRGGSGVPVGQRQIVVVHYAAYVEYADEPVDVAYSRAMGRSLKFQVDRGNALPGFEMAVKTMTPGEAAIFIVSSTLAYGKIGCPPRYPGGADIFYFIELLKVAPNDHLELAMQMPGEEREQLDFASVKVLVGKCRARVEFFFKQAEFRRAQSYQKWIIDLLEHCRTADADEDNTRLKLLQSSYSNGAVIAHKLRLPKAVLYHTGNVLKMDKNNRKALYMRISSLIALKDRIESLNLCRRALAFYPDNEQFTKLLNKVHEDRDLERKRERELYARMLGVSSVDPAARQPNTQSEPIRPTSPVPKSSLEPGEPEKVVLNQFERIVSDFKNRSAGKELVFSVANFTIQELVMLDRAVHSFGVQMDSLPDMNVRLRKT